MHDGRTPRGVGAPESMVRLATDDMRFLQPFRVASLKKVHGGCLIGVGLT